MIYCATNRRCLQTKETIDMSNRDGRPGFWSVVGSALAALGGVQKRANLERDFRHGKASHFIVAGLALTVLFVLAVVSVVLLVLSRV